MIGSGVNVVAYCADGPSNLLLGSAGPDGRRHRGQFQAVHALRDAPRGGSAVRKPAGGERELRGKISDFDVTIFGRLLTNTTALHPRCQR